MGKTSDLKSMNVESNRHETKIIQIRIPDGGLCRDLHAAPLGNAI